MQNWQKEKFVPRREEKDAEDFLEELSHAERQSTQRFFLLRAVVA